MSGFFIIIVVVIRKVSKGKDTSRRLHLERTATTSVCVGAVCSCAMGRSVCVCATQLVCGNPFGMLWLNLRRGHCDHALLRSGLKPSSRSQERAMSITVSHFPINFEEVTWNKQGCVFCSVVSRNMVLHSGIHGIRWSGAILFCTIRTFLNQKFWIKESVWELKLNLASGFMNRIFTFGFLHSDFKALHTFSLESSGFYFGGWVCILMNQKV